MWANNLQSYNNVFSYSSVQSAKIVILKTWIHQRAVQKSQTNKQTKTPETVNSAPTVTNSAMWLLNTPWCQVLTTNCRFCCEAITVKRGATSTERNTPSKRSSDFLTEWQRKGLKNNGRVLNLAGNLVKLSQRYFVCFLEHTWRTVRARLSALSGILKRTERRSQKIPDMDKPPRQQTTTIIWKSSCCGSWKSSFHCPRIFWRSGTWAKDLAIKLWLKNLRYVVPVQILCRAFCITIRKRTS